MTDRPAQWGPCASCFYWKPNPKPTQPHEVQTGVCRFLPPVPMVTGFRPAPPPAIANPGQQVMQLPLPIVTSWQATTAETTECGQHVKTSRLDA